MTTTAAIQELTKTLGSIVNGTDGYVESIEIINDIAGAKKYINKDATPVLTLKFKIVYPIKGIADEYVSVYFDDNSVYTVKKEYAHA